MTIRKDAVAGQFYPASAADIDAMIKHYNTILNERLKERDILKLSPKAVIVPHAGYVYSAFTANFAFRLLANTKPDTVAVIGPSHRVYVEGTSISDYDLYETPYGEIDIDKKTIKELQNKFSLHFIQEAHHEHSTEVQMPFLKKYIPDAKVVEMVYGNENPKDLALIIEYLLNKPNTAVVISTDLSHYYNIKKANRLDSICLNAVNELDPEKLNEGCEACGKIGMQALLIAAKKENLSPVLLDYRTSADASGDESQVVGYMSAAFTEK